MRAERAIASDDCLSSIRRDYAAPPHVPKDRLVDVSWAFGNIPNDLLDPYEPVGWLSGPEIPRLLFSLYPGAPAMSLRYQEGSGAWIVTHYDDIDRVYSDNEYFTNRGAAEYQRLIGETFPSIPLSIDPPEHTKYRMFLMPHFGPSKLNRMEAQIRDLVGEMIDSFAGRGEIDVAWDFGRVFPVRIFMSLMGFPGGMFDQFLDWEWAILHSNNREKMKEALRSVLDFLRAFMVEKEKEPDEFLVSYIVHGTIGGQPLTDNEKIGMIWFLWLGGLDTVAATISQMFRRMALQPDIQCELRNHPELIHSAVEEFLRTQPILSSARTAKKDFEWHGMTIKAGDKVHCLTPAGNFDPARFQNPRKFDVRRKANRHFTFVSGVHLCLGAPLARRELRILLDEWFKRIPEFRIKPGTDTTVFPGLFSIRHLPLMWEVK